MDAFLIINDFLPKLKNLSSQFFEINERSLLSFKPELLNFIKIKYQGVEYKLIFNFNKETNYYQEYSYDLFFDGVTIQRWKNSYQSLPDLFLKWEKIFTIESFIQLILSSIIERQSLVLETEKNNEKQSFIRKNRLEDLAKLDIHYENNYIKFSVSELSEEDENLLIDFFLSLKNKKLD